MIDVAYWGSSNLNFVCFEVLWSYRVLSMPRDSFPRLCVWTHFHSHLRFYISYPSLIFLLVSYLDYFILFFKNTPLPWPPPPKSFLKYYYGLYIRRTLSNKISHTTLQLVHQSLLRLIYVRKILIFTTNKGYFIIKWSFVLYLQISNCTDFFLWVLAILSLL